MNNLRKVSLDQEIDLHDQSLDEQKQETAEAKKNENENYNPLDKLMWGQEPTDQEQGVVLEMTEEQRSKFKGFVLDQYDLCAFNDFDGEEIKGPYFAGTMPRQPENTFVVSMSVKRNKVTFNSVSSLFDDKHQTTVNILPGSIFMMGNEFEFEVFVANSITTSDLDAVNVLQIKPSYFNNRELEAVRKAFMFQSSIMALGRKHALNQMQTNPNFGFIDIVQNKQTVSI
jgi:hypothetical protein